MPLPNPIPTPVLWRNVETSGKMLGHQNGEIGVQPFWCTNLMISILWRLIYFTGSKNRQSPKETILFLNWNIVNLHGLISAVQQSDGYTYIYILF